MLDTFQGLPVHSLIVHATVVMVPAAAFMVGLAAVYPRFRTWIGPGPALASIVAVILVPLSTMSGDQLFSRLKAHGYSGEVIKLIEHHQQLAGTLKYLIVPFALVAIADYFLRRRGQLAPTAMILIAVLEVALSVAVLVDVALIGHAGAVATWSGFVP
jgi:hypothetical protein